MAEQNNQLSQDIKDKLERIAAKYMEATYAVEEGVDWEVEACDKKIIDKEDISFLGIISGASSLSLDQLIDAGKLPTIEVELEGKIVRVADYRHPDFKDIMRKSEFIIAGMYYGKTPQYIERRFNSIRTKVIDYQNSKDGKKKK